MERGHAVVFGAGNMACGLLGPLLAQSGFATLFVARRPDVIDAINGRNGYTLHIAGDTAQRLAIRGCAALSARDERRVAEAVADADVVFTAVCLDNLACITPAIGAGLWRRSGRHGATPLNVIACENLPGAGAYLRHHVLGAVPPECTLTVDSVGGFSAGTTRRIMTGRSIARGELSVTIDAPGALVIDTQGLKRPLPPVQGATYTTEFRVLVLRKLFTLNCAHAVAAYLGYQEGCHYIHEAAVHPRVAPVLHGAVAEAQAALKAEFPHHAAIDREAAEALAQIANAHLADSVSRVARAPRRKLSPRERLVGPAHLARRHNLPHDNLCMAIAAALAYDDPADSQAIAMQEVIAAAGLDKVLTEDCGLLPHEGLARAVKQQWLSLSRDQAREVAPGAGALLWTGAAVADLVQTLAGDPSQVYDPTPRLSRTYYAASCTVSRLYGWDRKPWPRCHKVPCSRSIKPDGS